MDVWSFGPDQDVSRLAFSEVWIEVLAKARDIGWSNIQLCKIKSHLSYGEAVSRNVPFYAWRGNREADRLAREGTSLQAQPEPARSWYRTVAPGILQVGRFLGLMLGE
eukprot:5234967-Pyramimonas_sp.AAC.1